MANRKTAKKKARLEAKRKEKANATQFGYSSKILFK